MMLCGPDDSDCFTSVISLSTLVVHHMFLNLQFVATAGLDLHLDLRSTLTGR